MMTEDQEAHYWRLRAAIKAHRDASFRADIDPEQHDLALWSEDAADPMIDYAADRRMVRLKDGSTATLIAWRLNGDTVKVLTPEYRHRILPKAWVVEVML
jgi:hypothetical protein